MKNVLILAILILLQAFVQLGLAKAEGASSSRIYVVDVQKVIDESIAGKAARNNLQDEVRKTKSKLDLTRIEIDRESADLEKQVSLMSPEALSLKRDAISKKKRDFNLLLQDEDEKIKKKNGEEIRKLVERVQKIIQKMSAENNYKVVLEKDEVLVVYAADSIDITPQVLVALNKESMDS